MTESRLGELRERARELVARGAFDDAGVVYEELREELVSRFGDVHLYVAEVIDTLAGTARHAGDLTTARRYFEQAREMYRSIDKARAGSLDHLLAHLDPLPAEELARRPALVLVHENEGREHPMLYNQLYIGRGLERVHLLIHSSMLSRVHARVLWRAPDAFEMEDCRSENGTLFEGQPITRRLIGNGDVYLLGNERIMCRFTPRLRQHDDE
jgi:hypothetical protein